MSRRTCFQADMAHVLMQAVRKELQEELDALKKQLSRLRTASGDATDFRAMDSNTTERSAAARKLEKASAAMSNLDRCALKRVCQLAAARWVCVPW